MARPLPTHQDHALPKIGDAPDTAEFEHLESVLLEQLGEGLAAPELDVAAMPERAVVKVPFVEDRKHSWFCERDENGEKMNILLNKCVE